MWAVWLEAIHRTIVQADGDKPATSQQSETVHRRYHPHVREKRRSDEDEASSPILPRAGPLAWCNIVRYRLALIIDCAAIFTKRHHLLLDDLLIPSREVSDRYDLHSSEVDVNSMGFAFQSVLTSADPLEV